MASFNSICNFLPEGLKPILHLEQIADTLFTEMGSLRDIQGDVESHLLALETPQVKRSTQVETWMQEVDSLDQEVSDFEESFLRRTAGCSLTSLLANYHLGTRAIDLLQRVRDLKGAHGRFTSLVDQPPPETEPQASPSISVVGAGAVLSKIRRNLCDDDVNVLGIYGMGGIGKTTLVDQPPPETEPQASPSIPVVGAGAVLSEIRRNLCDDDVNVLGIYGMGGIGKTTLLSKIRDEMSDKSSQFDLVIWVTVSRDVNASNIRKTIRDQMGFSHSEFDGAVLSKKRVLLILDDMWARLDLETVGVPLQNKWKIAITTRSEQVCISMGANRKIKVPLLGNRESWELFREKVGTAVDIDGEPILPLAKIVVAKCGGLPLALVTVGRAMVDAKTTEKWQEAIQKLRDSPTEVRGMRDLFTLLKFSFDGLESNALRQCLQLCAVYEEDRDIYLLDLLYLWTGAGIIDGSDGSLNGARNEGLGVANKLKAACLLETGLQGEEYVKMHDGVRDMVLWVSSGDCGGDTLISYAGLGLTQFPPTKRWGEARWISIKCNEIEEVPVVVPHCPNLLVLIMSSYSSLSKPIPNSFFTFMPILRVLDLGSTMIEEIPKSIGSLVELQQLDLAWSDIISLPEEIGNLAKLRILNLRVTEKLTTVPRGSILKLSSLQYLNIADSGYTWDSDVAGDGQGEIIPASHDELDNLKQLELLGLSIETMHFLEKLLSSPVWSKAMGYLTLRGDSITSDSISRVCEVMEMLLNLDIDKNDELKELTFDAGRLMKLKYLGMWRLGALTRIVVRNEGEDHPFPSLRQLQALDCPKLKDFHCVNELLALTYLYLRNCPRIEELIVDGCEEKEEDTNQYALLLPNLVTMRLESLRNLTSISGRMLLLPSLLYLYVSGCPKLKKLPFGNGSAKKIKLIEGTQEWWDGLEWEDNIRSTFSPHFSTSVEEEEEEEDEDEDDDDDEKEDEDEEEKEDEDEEENKEDNDKEEEEDDNKKEKVEEEGVQVEEGAAQERENRGTEEDG